MSSLGNISTPQELRGAVAGKSDDEITQGVTAAGIDTVLEQVFNGMKDNFKPEAAGSQSAVIQYTIDTPEGSKVYQVVVANGACQVEKNGSAQPRVTLALNLPNFLKLITNHLNGMQAFMTGALKVTGDVMFAQTMQSWFKQPS
jgi:putative sterol carrier protein